MASRRMIDPSFWQSETVSRLPLSARYLFIGLFSNADDQGRMKAHPGIIRATVYPLDDIGLDAISADLDLLEAGEFITRYDAGGSRYIQVLNWWKYQRPTWAWPSELPAPEGWADRIHYRQGNKSIARNWGGAQDMGESDEGHGEPTENPKSASSEPVVNSPRTHGEPIVKLAPSGRGRDSGRNLSSSSTAPAPKAIEAFLQARGGAVGPSDVDRIDLMVEKAGEHVAVLARGSPGAGLTGDDWTAAAVEEAVLSQDGRGISLKYIEAILDRWIAQGFKSKPKQTGTTKGKRNGRDRAVSKSNDAPRGRYSATPETERAVAEWIAAHPNAAGPQ